MMSAFAKRIAIFNFGAQATTSATSTAATSSPSGIDSVAQGLLQSITEKIMQIFATAGNGLTSIFANAFHASEEICVDDQCLSKEDIKAMKAKLTKPTTQT